MKANLPNPLSCLLVGLAATKAISATAQASSRETYAETIVERPALARWSIIPTTHGAEIVREPLTEVGPVFQAGKPEVWVPQVMRCLWHDGLTVVRRGDSDLWRVATSTGDNNGMLQVWEFEAPAGGTPKILGTRTIAEVALTDSERASDFRSPVLIERDGRSWLMATVEGTLSTDGRIMLAELSKDLGKGLDAGKLLPARVIAAGCDPRVLDLGDEYLLAVRRLAYAAQSWGDAQVRFYRSRDLVTWQEDAVLSGGVEARGSFTLGRHGTTTWLATWRAGDQASDRTLALYRFDSDAKAWKRDEGASGARVRGTRSDGIWLLPDPKPSAARPRVAFVNAAGDLELR